MTIADHRFALLLLALGLLGTPGLRGEGAALYGKRCALCHGKDGGGDTPAGRTLKARDLRSADIQKLTDAELAAVIAKGKQGKMPPFKDSIPAKDIAALVAYLRTLKKL